MDRNKDTRGGLQQWISGADQYQVERLLGRIDSNLRFRQDRLAALPVAGSFTPLFVPSNAGAPKSNQLGTQKGEWKIEGSLRARSADITSAMRYLEKMRDQSSDATLRKNADTAIHALQHFQLGCQVPNPC